MKDRKYSDTSDAFLCDILSRKCNQFLNSCSNSKGKQLLEINQTLKFTTSQAKTTKTIITKNKIIYSNIISQSTIREVVFDQSQELRKKEEQLLIQLMRHIIQNIKNRIQDILISISQAHKSKDIFKSIVFTLEDQFKSVNQELCRVRQYTKRKQIKDVLNLQINNLTPCKFVGLIFTSLPKLKNFFVKFQIETLTNEEIIQLRKDIQLIDELIQFDQIIQKRINEKKAKKKNKKKKNKLQKQNSTNEGGEIQQINENCTNTTYQVAQFLKSLVIGKERAFCHAAEDWVKSLKLKYEQ